MNEPGSETRRRHVIVSNAGLMLLLVAVGPGVATSQVPNEAGGARDSTKRILLLHAESREQVPAGARLADSFRATLQSRWPGALAFYEEQLDLSLFKDGTPPPEVRELLRVKHQDRRFDLVVPMESRTLRIAVANRAALFSGAPIVFAAVDRTAANDIPLDRDVTGTWLSQGWAGTLEAALALQPRTRRVVVVGGIAATDRVWLATARQQLTPYQGRLEISYLTDMVMADVLARVSALPPDSVVLLGAFVLDAAGQRFVPWEAAARIAAASSVPVYGPAAVLTAGGVVGGDLVSYEAHGRLAAELAIRVLQGERPPPIDRGTLVPTFDWRQLRRWGFDDERLPAGSVVLFRPASAWERYRGWILGALTLIALQALLIGALLVQRTRNRRAEARVRASEAALRTQVDRVQDLAGRLVSAQEEERGRIARELHDDVGQRVASLAIGLSGLKRQLPAAEPGVRDELSHLQQETLGLSKDLRQLSHELHPGVLEHVGLVEALRGRCDEVSAEAGIRVQLDVSDDWVDVPDDVARCLYRVAQEGFRNVVKHARATGAELSLARRDGQVLMRIRDDGRGFEPGAAAERRGLGLVSMGERVRLLGGRLDVEAALNAGTEVVVTLPVGDRV